MVPPGLLTAKPVTSDPKDGLAVRLGPRRDTSFQSYLVVGPRARNPLERPGCRPGTFERVYDERLILLLFVTVHLTPALGPGAQRRRCQDAPW